LNISLIENANHSEFAPIKRLLNTGSINQPVSQPLGDPYFTVVLHRKPQSGYPKLRTPQNLPPSEDSIDDAITGYHAVIFRVQNVQADQDLQIEYVPNKFEYGRLTKGQSTVRTGVILN
jgi:hypothetical protein